MFTLRHSNLQLLIQESCSQCGMLSKMAQYCVEFECIRLYCAIHEDMWCFMHVEDSTVRVAAWKSGRMCTKHVD